MANPFMTAGNTDNDGATAENLPVFTEIDWDFDKNKFVRDRQGNFKIVEKNEALKVWIKKAILVERYRYQAYFDNYGAELEHFIGREPNDGSTASEVFRYIKEALLVNPYILSVTDVSVTQEHKKLIMTVGVDSIYGDTTTRLEV